jgi:predicted metalloprotease with PDZ domain
MAREGLAFAVGALVHQKVRAWRPLADTARSGWLLRGGSTYWRFLRRSQDYYTEGAFIWLEVDMRLRRLTDGEKSLDDFCAAFFGSGDPGAHAVPFDEAEVIELLNALAPYDWGGLFRDRVHDAPGEELPHGIALSGWRLGTTDEPSRVVETSQKLRKNVNLYDAIGLAVGTDGRTGSVVPGSAAATAGIVEGLEILGIGGRRFTTDRLLDAVRATPESGKIELLADEAGHLKTYTIVYDGGLRYLTLERDAVESDLLSEILAPRRRM